MVLHLLQLEWKKYSESSLLRLLLIFYIVALPLSFYGFIQIYEMINSGGDEEGINISRFLVSPGKIKSFPMIWEHLAYWGNWSVSIFITYISIYLISSEAQYKTLRQNIITGFTRREFFLSKLFAIIAISLFCTIYYVLIAMLTGLIFSPEYDIFSDKLWAIPRYFLMVLNYSSLGLLLGFVLRKSGLALFLFLAYLSFGELLLRVLYRRYIPNNWHAFFPLNSNEDLTLWPMFKLKHFLPVEWTEGLRLLTPTEAVISSIIYTALFLFLAYRSLKTRDL